MQRLILLFSAAASLAAQTVPDPVLAEWSFSTAGDRRGWKPSAAVADVAVRDGALHGRARAAEAMFIGPDFEIRTETLQRVEIRMRADKGGQAKLYWAPALTGRYGGFEPDRMKRFPLHGDGQFHDYTILPLWSADPVIYRLRIDIPDGTTVDIASVRVVGLAAGAGTPVPPRWEFERAGDAEGWRAIGREAQLTAANGVLSVRAPGPLTLLAPAAAIAPPQMDWVSVRMKSAVTMPFSVWWTAAGCKGVARRPATLIGDGAFHTYNIDVGGAGCWWAGADRLGLDLPAGPGFEIDWVRAAATPGGEPELAVEVLSAVRAINRANAPFEVACNLVNRGGRAVSGARARIRVPAGITVEAEPPAPATLYFGEPQRLVWRLRARAAGDVRISVEATAPGAAPGRAEAVVPITEPPAVARATYAPEPRPARTPFEIGAYYYPGWWNHARWDPVRRFPERTPALGFYKEGDPQVLDWHIKYAVEHGVKFFAIDWYWRNGKEDLNHLYPAIQTARFRKHFRYCFLYANHNPFNIHDRAEWLTITRFWLDHHFMREEFYRIEGKPVVILFTPNLFRQVLKTSAAVKEALDAARQLAKERGLPGIYFMACTRADVAELRRLRDEGYDSATAYNYSSAGAEGNQRAPYSAMVDGYASAWDQIRAAGLIDYAIPAAPGWDPRPWHGEDTMARPGNTPAEFRRMLTLARERMDPYGPPPRRTLLIEAWNEWGEGSILEPELRYGFGQLDAVREVFCPDAGPHADLVPTDLGLPLIEWEAPAPAARWDFTAGGPAGWSGTHLTGLRVEGGHLWGRTSSPDARLTSPEFRTPARPYTKAVLRMAASQDVQAQLYWQTADAAGMSELRSIRFAVKPGPPRAYELPLGGNANWRGTITRWRLDPAARAGVDVQVESLELVH